MRALALIALLTALATSGPGDPGPVELESTQDDETCGGESTCEEAPSLAVTPPANESGTSLRSSRDILILAALVCFFLATLLLNVRRPAKVHHHRHE